MISKNKFLSFFNPQIYINLFFLGLFFLAFFQYWAEKRSYVGHGQTFEALKLIILVALISFIIARGKAVALIVASLIAALFSWKIGLPHIFIYMKAFAVAVFLQCLIFFTGTLFSKIIHKNLILNFFEAYISGYLILGMLLWLPIVFEYKHTRELYIVFSLLSLLSLCIYFFAQRKYFSIHGMLNNQKLFLNELDKTEKFILVFLIISLLIPSFLYSFSFDDLNGYFIVPMRIAFDGWYEFTPNKPSLLTNISLHSQSYGSALAVLSSADRDVFLFSRKFFDCMAYTIPTLLFISSIKALRKLYLLRVIFACLLLLIPVISVELQGNFADFPVFLCALIIASFMIRFNANRIISLYFMVFILGLSLAFSLKNLPYIAAFIIIFSIYRKFKYLNITIKHFILMGCLGLFPVSIMLLRTYLLTGNPTFPAMNHIWKSPFFITDASSIVVSKFRSAISMDIGTFLGIMSSDPKKSSFFYPIVSPEFGFAIPTLLVGSLFLVFHKLIINDISLNSKYKYSLALSLLSIAFISYILVSYTTGPQHRYFIGVVVLVIFLIFIIFNGILSGLNSYAKKLFLQKYKLCFCALIGFGIIPYYLNSFTALPLKNNDGLVTTINGLRWIEKRNFYAKVNAEIGRDQRNILLYYIQDKFFIDSTRAYELDWYDFPIQKKLDTAFLREGGIPAVVDKLCEMNFGYIILSKDATVYDPSFRLNLDEKINGGQQSLFELRCRNNS